MTAQPLRVTFKNTQTGAMLAGLQWTPSVASGDQLPALVIVAPGSTVKEQAASVYAARMAELGYLTLAFDHTSYGESEGGPDRDEDPFMKTEDIKSAVSYLTTLDQVDAKRIGALGICAGGGYAVFTAVGDRRIAAVAAVTPMISMRDVLASGLMGPLDQVLASSGQARTAYAEGSPAVYMPVVPVETDMPFGLDAQTYYFSERGATANWRNEWLLWSLDKQILYNPLDVAPLLAPTPLLVIVGENAATRGDGERLYAVANEPKQYAIIDDASHFDLYDLEPYVSRAVEHAGRFFSQNL